MRFIVFMMLVEFVNNDICWVLLALKKIQKIPCLCLDIHKEQLWENKQSTPMFAFQRCPNKPQTKSKHPPFYPQTIYHRHFPSFCFRERNPPPKTHQQWRLSQWHRFQSDFALLQHTQFEVIKQSRPPFVFFHQQRRNSHHSNSSLHHTASQLDSSPL